MEILMDERNHITQKITSWPQPHLHPFSQEVISTKVSPQRDFTTCGYQRTEPSTSLNTEAACSNYPISLAQELRPNMKHLEREETQDVSPIGKDHKPIISSTLCFTVEDPYFGPESPPASENPSVMGSMVHEIWMENPCSTIPSLALNNQVLELPKHDCNDKGMKTYDF